MVVLNILSYCHYKTGAVWYQSVLREQETQRLHLINRFLLNIFYFSFRVCQCRYYQ